MQTSINNFHREAVEKVKVNKHLLMGYLFLFLVFMGAISSVYYWENKERASRAAELLTMPRDVTSGEQVNDNNAGICAQVITPAVNRRTGETKDFPTPCDIYGDWESVQ